MEPVSRMQRYVPPLSLRGLISGVAYEERGLPPGVHHGLPSCGLTVVIPLETTLELLAAPDGHARSMRSCVGGLHAAPAYIGHDGVQVGFQLSISPLGAPLLFGRPAADLAGAVVEIDELWGADGRELVERLHGADRWPERAAVLDELLTRRLNRSDERVSVGAEITYAFRRLAAGDPGTTVAGVATEVGWSRRHLGQRFVDEFGLTPKTIGRVARFQRAADVLKRAHDAPLVDVALGAGYADQAHMTRDWREFAGLTPAAWRRAEVRPAVDDEVVAA